MGMAAAATAMRNRLNRSKDWRAHKRSQGDTAFLKAETELRRRYNEYTQLSREFSKTYANEFQHWLKAKMQNNQAPRQPFGQSRHISETMSATPASVTALMPAQWRPTSDVIPSAAAMESRRLESAGNNRLAELGIRLD